MTCKALHDLALPSVPWPPKLFLMVLFFPWAELSLFESENESRSVMSNSLQPRRLYSPWNSPGQNTGVGGLSLLQGIFSTQG